MKALKLMLYYCNIRFKLVDSEVLIKQFNDRADKVECDEETNTIREQEIRKSIRISFQK
jgi:hypothetical protein